MAKVPVARRYARALLELASEQKKLEPIHGSLSWLSEAFDQSETLRQALLNPGVKLKERRAVIEALAQKQGWDQLFKNFVMLLLDRDRLRYVREIAEDFSAGVDEKAGRVRARVSSATALSDAQLAEVKAALAKMTGKEVLVETSVDEALIGGVVARVGGSIYDGSVRTQLKRMREAILKEV
ncbi:F0F1 ATP synthase subunit delta [Lujinxingia vulgaris]|uniref:ATP synthase subunit delta n=1 Tax=Lujinxingia vulgaris TaxID=2600176 RepID=A0A5C6XC73_9DELT|nr:ATP synthase F1 subunit delta [Lujinxingia vulgaris]TXD34985.1 F0F1 ATP synthase subunit delta [Lujinxingia vulgaris]